MPSKQDIIREGIAKTLYTFEYDGWGKLSEGDRVMWLSRADAIMNKEHSQGVVVKVDRKLPEYVGDNSLGDNITKALAEEVQQDMLKAGFTSATEPLIKEE